MIVDFHSHTVESDGSLAPRALVEKMERRGVRIFSVTDHDTMRAYASLGEVHATVVTGIEINTSDGLNDVHVLGYRLPLENEPLGDLLESNRRHRRLRVEAMVERLRAGGYPLALEDVLAESSGDAIGRPHVAKALIRRGLVRDAETVFRTVLGRGGAGFVPSQHIVPADAIAAILAAGGVPVLAHPGRLHDDGIIASLVEMGLRGIEVFYPSHTTPQVARYRELAGRYGLVMTAGSDFHDARWRNRDVGVDVDARDIAPFLALVA